MEFIFRIPSQLSLNLYFQALLFGLSILASCHSETAKKENTPAITAEGIVQLKKLLGGSVKLEEAKLDSIGMALEWLQKEEIDTFQMANLYRDLGWRYFYNQSYSSAYLNFTKSCEIAQATNDSIAWSYGLLANAQLQHSIGNYDQAIQVAHEALEIAKNLTNQKLLHLAYEHCVQIDFDNKNYQLASQSAYEAIETFQSASADKLMHFYNVLGLIDLHLNRWQAAKARFFESLEAAKSRPETDKGFLYGNLGTAYFKLGMLDSARYFMGADLKWSLLQGYKQSAFNAAIGLIEIMVESKSFETKQARFLLHMADSLQQQKDISTRPDDYQTRLQLIKKLPVSERLTEMEKLLARMGTETFQKRTNARQERKNIHELSETVSKLNLSKNRTAFAEKTRNFLFLGIACIIALFILTLILIRKKYAHQLTEHKHLRSKYQHLTEELTTLQGKIEINHHELESIREMNGRLKLERSYMQAQNEQAMINKAYLLTVKQKTIDKLVQMLENPTSSADQTKRMVHLALNELQQLEQAAIHLSPAQGTVNQDFEKFIHATYPELTADEIKHLMYIRMNMSTSEIARIKSITVAGVNKSRNRMRKKLGLKPTDDLRDFVMTI